MPGEDRRPQSFPKGTVRKAVAHLREAGVLYTLPQKGTFVSAIDADVRDEEETAQ